VLRELGRRSSGGGGLERMRRDGSWSARADQSETKRDGPNGFRDSGLEDGDGARDGEHHIVVVCVIVKTRDPRGVRRAGMGERCKREQSA